MPIHRFEIRPKRPGGPRSAGILADAHALGLGRVQAVRCADLYFIRGTCTPEELKLLGRFLFCDPVQETVYIDEAASPDGETSRRIEVAFRPGVTDAVAEEILRAAGELGIAGIEAVATGGAFDIEGASLSEGDLAELASRLLSNPIIQRWARGRIEPTFAEAAPSSARTELIPIGGMSDAELEALSADRRAALELPELHAIRDFFRAEGRACSDVEFEMIAQTWSEHCVHKTFRALVEVDAPRPHPYPERVDNILKSYIKKATDEIDAPWVLSAFVDNAGVVEFDESHELSFKVETHNHPSAVEPFGGANTGLGGVIRDVLGVSARPIAATDVLCFGPQDAAFADLPSGVIHPRLIASGVVSGIRDYGNKMGIPTVNGAIRFDPGYSANPLVYCGCVGMAPRGLRKSEARAGHRVVVIGGRTGRDGLRGATFSSMAMDSSTGELAGASVQIGDPIVEKKAAEVIVQARDLGLYSAITDCGAGGLSSAVGEMAAELGADIDLALVPLKYPGLVPWEVWLSEAQERMVLAVPPESLQALRLLCAANEVELSDLGAFSGIGRLIVRHGATTVLDLPGAFLHGGMPQRRLRAAPPASRPSDPVRTRQVPPEEALLALLAHPNIASKEAVVRQYDHEVQGATCVRPFTGPERDGPSDAAVLKPLESAGTRGLAISNGFNPDYGKVDPYRMALSAVDEALRNAVAVGADPDRFSILDNFCWGDPRKPETMWSLLEAARGCYDAAIAIRAPFISGKDSFNNEYRAQDGSRVSIPPSLLISGLGIVPDVGKALTMDLKRPGDSLYLVGQWKPVFGGSAYSSLFGRPTKGRPEVPDASALAPAVYRALHALICRGGVIAACHDLSEGGLAVALAEMCMGGRLGARIALEGREAELSLFGESNGCLLVEIAADKAEAFETAFAGLPFLLLGQTQSAQELVMDGAQALRLPLASLLKAWKGRGA